MAIPQNGFAHMTVPGHEMDDELELGTKGSTMGENRNNFNHSWWVHMDWVLVTAGFLLGTWGIILVTWAKVNASTTDGAGATVVTVNNSSHERKRRSLISPSEVKGLVKTHKDAAQQ